MNHTAEEVRAEAKNIRDYSRMQPGAGKEWDRTADMLTTYADMIERQAKGAADEVVPTLVSAACDAYDEAGGSRVVRHQMRAALLAVWPVAITSEPGAQHHDDVAVDAFAQAMKAKLAEARTKGRGGWQDKADCPQRRLSDMLRGHVAKGDPRDVANFCMMLHQRGEAILPDEPVAQDGVCGAKCHRIQENRDYWHGVAEGYRQELFDAKQALAAQPRAVPDGIALAAAYIQKKADEYAAENCESEPDTGAPVYRYGNAGMDYHYTLIELAEEVAALAAATQPGETS